MEDRYLYRAKRIDNGEWVIGYYTYYPTGMNNTEDTMHAIRDTSTNPGKLYFVDPSTICQCTGLKDKNGKLIWENDITYMRCNGLSGYGKVIYENGCFWIDDKKRGRKYPFSNHDVKYRVDGNIFDNPELLDVRE